MRPLLYRILILLAIFGLIVTPPVLTGYANLRQAESAYLALDDLRATGNFERAAMILPWRPDLWDQAGITRFRTKNFTDAIRLLEIAKERDALSDVGWDVLGISYYETGNPDKAAAAWENGLEAFPSYAKYYSHLILVFHEQGNIQAEGDALERWVLSDGAGDASAHYRLGQMLSISNQERALDEFQLASELDPEYDSVVVTMRTSLNLAALANDETSRLVIVGRGLGLVGEWSLAEAAFRQAVAADGENAEARAWLGEAEQQSGRDGRAELDEALSLDRMNPVVRSLRGVYWMRKGRGDQALAEFLLAAEYDPDNPAWQISIGDAYAERGDLQAALNAYLRATAMDPTDAALWRALAGFSTRYNTQVEEVGLPAARKAIELGGEDPQSLDVLGWALALLERFEEAQDALQKALSIDPGFAPAYLHLGILAMQTSDWEGAHEYLLQARDLDADGQFGGQAKLLLNQYFP